MVPGLRGHGHLHVRVDDGRIGFFLQRCVGGPGDESSRDDADHLPLLRADARGHEPAVYLRHRALKHTPEGTISLLPSALIPWIFLGYCRKGEDVRIFKFHALKRTLFEEQSYEIYDKIWCAYLQKSPEFKVMRNISPAYHVVKSIPGEETVTLTCRDLRTRNFNTNFGQLDFVVEKNTGEIKETRFYV